MYLKLKIMIYIFEMMQDLQCEDLSAVSRMNTILATSATISHTQILTIQLHLSETDEI